MQLIQILHLFSPLNIVTNNLCRIYDGSSNWQSPEIIISQHNVIHVFTQQHKLQLLRDLHLQYTQFWQQTLCVYVCSYSYIRHTRRKCDFIYHKQQNMNIFLVFNYCLSLKFAIYLQRKEWNAFNLHLKAILRNMLDIQRYLDLSISSKCLLPLAMDSECWFFQKIYLYRQKTFQADYYDPNCVD